MYVLAIGNSFSQDATRYLHEIAKADNVDLTVVNLPIGGCSLSRHYENMLNDAKAYSLEYNGCITGFRVSIKEALLSNPWDFVTFQQVSHLSNDYGSYQPYLNELSAYVKEYVPGAKQLMHQTWAYEQGGPLLCEKMGYKDQMDMYQDVKEAYERAAQEIGAEFIIPSGSVFQELMARGIKKVHRDGFHARLGVGRYALGLAWYRALTGNDVINNTFCDFDEPVSEEEMKIAKQSCYII